MYLSSKKHILTTTLIAATMIQLVSTIVQLVFQYVQSDGGDSGVPSSAAWSVQHIATGFTIFLTVIIFCIAIKKVKGLIDVVDAEDRKEMGRLQEDKLGEGLSALPAEMIHKLLGIWGVIMVGIGIIQTIVIVMYRKLVGDLGAIGSGDGDMTVIYNQMDGFKNLTIVFALLLGVIITAVMLENRFFTILSAIIGILFLTAFCILNVKKVALFGVQVGIEWTQIAFYLINTVGMIAFAIYLRVRYKGV